MARVRIHIEARIELLDAADWYYVRSIESAQRFRESFNALLALIDSQPESFPKYDQQFRFGKLEHYPYLIVFRYQDDLVDVIAVAHSRRKYGYWRDRHFEQS